MLYTAPENQDAKINFRPAKHTQITIKKFQSISVSLVVFFAIELFFSFTLYSPKLVSVMKKENTCCTVKQSIDKIVQIEDFYWGVEQEFPHSSNIVVWGSI